jgi:hypothetical protein
MRGWLRTTFSDQGELGFAGWRSGDLAVQVYAVESEDRDLSYFNVERCVIDHRIPVDPGAFATPEPSRVIRTANVELSPRNGSTVSGRLTVFVEEDGYLLVRGMLRNRPEQLALVTLYETDDCSDGANAVVFPWFKGDIDQRFATGGSGAVRLHLDEFGSIGVESAPLSELGVDDVVACGEIPEQ